LSYAWDYEESATNYYNIFPVDEEAEAIGEGTTLDIPQSPKNDEKVQKIVDLLNSLEV